MHVSPTVGTVEADALQKEPEMRFDRAQPPDYCGENLRLSR